MVLLQVTPTSRKNNLIQNIKSFIVEKSQRITHKAHKSLQVIYNICVSVKRSPIRVYLLKMTVLNYISVVRM